MKRESWLVAAIVLMGLIAAVLMGETRKLPSAPDYERAEFMLECVNNGYKVETCKAILEGEDPPYWPDAEPDYQCPTKC